MSKLRVPMGNYATTPYRLGEEKQAVYCLEELCYYFVQQSAYIDQEEMNHDLVEWIDTQLGLRDLARDLLAVMRGMNTFALFVSTILDYAHYLPREELVVLREVLNENGKLNPYERRKKRIDKKAADGDVGSALFEYQQLYLSIKSRDVALSGEILVAMGKAAMQLFLYDYAMELFLKSYHMTYQKDALLNYFMAVLLHYGDAKAREKMADLGSFPDLEAEARERIESVRKSYAISAEKEKADSLIHAPKDGAYYAQVADESERLKQAYRR